MNNLGNIMTTLAVTTLLLTLTACTQAVDTPDAPSEPSTPSVPTMPTEPTTPEEPAGPSPPVPPEPTPTRPTDPRVRFINPDGAALSNELYTLELGTASAEVFVISTNTTTRPAIPRIARLDSGRRAEQVSQPRPAASQSVPEPVWLRDLQKLPPLRAGRTDREQHLAQAQSPVAVGDRFVFVEKRENEILVRVPATARKVIRAGATTLAVWVADREWWATCVSIGQCLTGEMVDAIATQFLRPGTDNDIYDWVTTIFGAPWGPHRYFDLIPATAADQIHILLLDIDGDGPSSVVGFYSLVHSLRQDPAEPVTHASAERLIFFIDSATLSIPEGPTWEVTDSRPSAILDTLAHEFQHMIHFYQKQIVHNLPPTPTIEAWLNEMASEVTTDLIADKLGLPPTIARREHRGTPPADSRATTTGTTFRSPGGTTS